MVERVAIVTGANKGLGFSIVKGLCARFEGIVYLTARNETLGLEAVKKLNTLGFKPEFHQLDVSDRASIVKLAKFIKEKHGGFDVLVNNAAILEYSEVYPSYEAAKRNIDVNFRSLLDIEQVLFSLLRDGARVVNVSSACGHLSNIKNKEWLKNLKQKDLRTEDIIAFVNNYLDTLKNGTFNKNDFADNGKHAEHRVSKIALTALTMVQQKKYKNISINAIYPGHIKTDMAAGGGELDPDEAAKTVLYLLLDASPNLKGSFMWDNRRLIDWYDAEGDYYYKHQD